MKKKTLACISVAAFAALVVALAIFIRAPSAPENGPFVELIPGMNVQVIDLSPQFALHPWGVPAPYYYLESFTMTVKNLNDRDLNLIRVQVELYDENRKIDSDTMTILRIPRGETDTFTYKSWAPHQWKVTLDARTP